MGLERQRLESARARAGDAALEQSAKYQTFVEEKNNAQAQYDAAKTEIARKEASLQAEWDRLAAAKFEFAQQKSVVTNTPNPVRQSRPFMTEPVLGSQMPGPDTGRNLLSQFDRPQRPAPSSAPQLRVPRQGPEVDAIMTPVQPPDLSEPVKTAPPPLPASAETPQKTIINPDSQSLINTDPRYRNLPSATKRAFEAAAHEETADYVPQDARFNRSRIEDTETSMGGLSPIAETSTIKSVLPEIAIGPAVPKSDAPESRADICSNLKDALGNFERQPDDMTLRNLIGKLTGKLASTRLSSFAGQNLKNYSDRLLRSGNELNSEEFSHMAKLIEELCEGLWGKTSSNLAYKKTSQQVQEDAVSGTPSAPRAEVNFTTPLLSTFDSGSTSGVPQGFVAPKAPNTGPNPFLLSHRKDDKTLDSVQRNLTEHHELLHKSEKYTQRALSQNPELYAQYLDEKKRMESLQRVDPGLPPVPRKVVSPDDRPHVINDYKRLRKYWIEQYMLADNQGELQQEIVKSSAPRINKRKSIIQSLKTKKQAMEAQLSKISTPKDVLKQKKSVTALEQQIFRELEDNKKDRILHEEAKIAYEKSKSKYVRGTQAAQNALKQIRTLQDGLPVEPNAILAFTDQHLDAHRPESDGSDISISRSDSDISQTEIDTAIKQPKKLDRKILKHEKKIATLTTKYTTAHNKFSRYDLIGTPEKQKRSRFSDIFQLVKTLQGKATAKKKTVGTLLQSIKKALPQGTPFKTSKFTPKIVNLNEHSQRNLQTVMDALKTGEFENPYMAILLRTIGQKNSTIEYQEKSGKLFKAFTQQNEYLEEEKVKLGRYVKIKTFIPKKPGDILGALKRKKRVAKAVTEEVKLGAKRRMRAVGSSKRTKKIVSGKDEARYFPNV